MPSPISTCTCAATIRSRRHSPQACRKVAERSGGIFADIDDVTQVDHIGGLLRPVGTEDRVPAGAVDAAGAEQGDVLTVAAAVVEDGGGRVDHAAVEGGFHRAGQVAAADRGLVAGGGAVVVAYFADSRSCSCDYEQVDSLLNTYPKPTPTS